MPIERYIKNAQITHVSYVDKAANKKKFFLTKADDRRAVEPNVDKTFDLIAKKDDPQRLVYGVVYEPDTADAHNEAMKAPEIEKAAHGFMKDARNLDKQHDFSTGMGEVVESYVAPETFTYAGQEIAKGSWVLVTKATEEIWEGIQKGEITGYSMGGVGEKEDVTKNEDGPEDEKELGKFMKAMKAFFTKGEVTDRFNEDRLKRDFRAARRIFDDIMIDEFIWNDNPDTERISAAARDMADLFDKLAKSDNVVKALGGVEEAQAYALSVQKDGHTEDTSPGEGDHNTKEEDNVNKDLEKTLKSVVEEATKPLMDRVEKLEKAQEDEDNGEETVTKEDGGEKDTGKDKVEKNEDDTNEDGEKMAEMVKKAVEEGTAEISKRLDKVEKARGVKKSEEDEGDSEEVTKAKDDDSIWDGLL